MDAVLTKTDAPQSISDLKPHPRNPREISEAHLDGLQASLARWGDLGGITWNRKTGHVIGGHQRIKALQAEHGAALHLQDGVVVTPDGQRFPVRVVDLSEDEEAAAMVAANANQGEWSGDLPELLADIQLQLPDDFTVLGFDDLAGGISTEPTSTDPAADLAEAIAATEEAMEATNTVARIVSRIEQALHKRAEADPAALNRALMIVLPMGRAGETAVLVDPAMGDACQELRRAYLDGDTSPIEQLMARAFSFGDQS